MVCEPSPEDVQQASFAAGLRALQVGAVPFLVGGGWALFEYLGRCRVTKDIDVFLCEEEVERALAVLANAGFEVELTDATWLAKARQGHALIDIIFCSYNGLFPVDLGWHDNAREARVLEVPVRIVGPEEMIVSKCFVAARDRFDGADVSSLLRVLGPDLDWARIEALMGDHWEVLLWQLIHFLYVFPSERGAVPGPLVARLMARMRRRLASVVEDQGACRAAMLDPKLYRAEPDWDQIFKRHVGG